MRYAVDPRQNRLFDPAKMMFSPMAIKYLQQDWPGLFRSQILHLMPAGKIAKNFHPRLGCPTKELYSMAGVIFLKEFFNLTIAETVQRCLLDSAWHYALNIVPNEASMSHASIERYAKLFAEDDIASDIFHRVTLALIEALEYVIHHTPAQRRLSARRAEQRTNEFKENYSVRAGGESVNSGLKRSTGMGRVRTRGLPRVRMAVMLRCAGWNIRRALAILKKRGMRDYATLNTMTSRFCAACCCLFSMYNRPRIVMRIFVPSLRKNPHRYAIGHMSIAA